MFCILFYYAKGKKLKAHYVSLVVALSSLGFLGEAYAWGPEGHALIADMAEAHLDAKPKAEVKRLLMLEGKRHLDDISSWADAYRTDHPESGPGHFVDIPLDEASYDENRDCHFDKDNHHVEELTCIVVKLPYYVNVLSDRARPEAERLEALKWVVHLVGDVHQPLHAEDNHHDKGGNNIHITYYDNPTNLHAIWDGGVIEYNYSWKLGPNFSIDHKAVRLEANNLDNEITNDQRAVWAPPGVVASIGTQVTHWANESHRLASAAYEKLASNSKPGWEDDYQAYAWPVIKGQLDIAAARLSRILNEALK